MGRKKVYGESKINECPFCGKTAIAKNSQGVPVCLKHKSRKLENMKCACGDWLDILEGKWGAYCHCFNCGNINLKKGLEMNPQVNIADKKEITVRSDEVDFI